MGVCTSAHGHVCSSKSSRTQAVTLVIAHCRSLRLSRQDAVGWSDYDHVKKDHLILLIMCDKRLWESKPRGSALVLRNSFCVIFGLTRVGGLWHGGHSDIPALA